MNAITFENMYSDSSTLLKYILLSLREYTPLYSHVNQQIFIEKQ